MTMKPHEQQIILRALARAQRTIARELGVQDRCVGFAYAIAINDDAAEFGLAVRISPASEQVLCALVDGIAALPSALADDTLATTIMKPESH